MVYQDVEKTKTFLKENWLTAILDIFKTCQKKKQLPPDARLQVSFSAFTHPFDENFLHFYSTQKHCSLSGFSSMPRCSDDPLRSVTLSHLDAGL